MNKDGKILIKDKDNITHECDILFTFDSDETKKSYVVYTDNTKDELGNIKVYANTFDPFSNEGDLGEIKTEKEWATIEQIFASINEKKEG